LRRGFAEGTDGISKSRLWRVSSAMTAGDVRNADIPHAILPIENADIAGHGRIDTEEPVVPKTELSTVVSTDLIPGGVKPTIE
jgi:hypothetical protein